MNTALLIIIGILLMSAAVAAISFFILRLLRQEMKASQEDFLKLAQQQFALEQSRATTELETRKQAVESSVQGLKEELARYQSLLRELEKDRDQKYGQLESELKNASQATQKLQETTLHLNNILGNVKLRGQWGERMAEDIIRYAGLIEGINYIKQKRLEQSATKPDYTFFLPDEHKINMDVKFPLDNYIQMVNAPSGSDRDNFQKEFLRNVKERIKEIQNRDYINPSENTLDFVLLFIPNEQVYGFIQEQTPDLFDSALGQKVVLCSPFTLYAMLCVIRQAYENFRYEKNIKQIIQLIEQFVGYYERFKARFDEFGEMIGKLEQKYADLKDKSMKQLDTKIRHIDGLKKGKPAAFLPEGGSDPMEITASNSDESL